jgi:hypothetical protein
MLGALLWVEAASAVPAVLQTTPSIVGAHDLLMEKLRWSRCRYWARVCAWRWGWDTYGNQRCLWCYAC